MEPTFEHGVSTYSDLIFTVPSKKIRINMYLTLLKQCCSNFRTATYTSQTVKVFMLVVRVNQLTKLMQ